MDLKAKQEKEAQLIADHGKCIAEIQRLTTAAANIQGYLLRLREEIAEEAKAAEAPNRAARRRLAKVEKKG